MTNPLSVRLEDIESCFEGAIPTMLASCSLQGVPNVADISIVHRIDATHVGLSRQFFNKTIANLQTNPRAMAIVVEPNSGRLFRLDLVFDHTESEGPLFDRVKAVLDAVASHDGMAKIFRLAAVDVCRVISCEKVPTDWDHTAPTPVSAGFDVLDAFSLRLAAATDAEDLIESALDACAQLYGCEHSFMLMLAESGDRLYTVASHGYEASGVGAEVSMGEGIIGVAAQRRQPVRVGNMTSDLAYVHAVRSSFESAGGDQEFERNIPLPGLANTLSQLAVPIVARNQLLGVLCLQSEQAGRFSSRDEAAFSVAARQIGLSMQLLRLNTEHDPMITAQVEPAAAAPVAQAATTQVRHYPADDSIFFDGEYVIKGVAGRVLWRLLHSFQDERRTDFTNKEIRLDPHLDLPDIKDNLEARLILLRRRLEERGSFCSIQNTGRGRFRLEVQHPFDLKEFA